MENQVPLKCYTKKQLRLMYDVNVNTFKKWLNKIEPKLLHTGYNRNQSILTIKQVSIVFEELCPPEFEFYEKIMHIKK